MMDIIEKARAFAADKPPARSANTPTSPTSITSKPWPARCKAQASWNRPFSLPPTCTTPSRTPTRPCNIIRDFGEDVCKLVYWLTGAEEGNRESRTLMSSWRLARAPLPAKLIKFSVIIDNATSIREHDRGFFKLWAAEKVEILKRMLEVEGSGLGEHALFKRARAATTV